MDAGYMYGKDTSADIAAVSLRPCDLSIVGPVAWKARIEQADWKEIAEFSWIGVSDYCAFCQMIEEAFQQRNLTVSKKVAVVDEEETLKTLVTSGIGLSLMVEDEALANEKEGKIVIWPKDKFQSELCFTYLRKREQEPVIQAVLNAVLMVWGTADHEFSVHPQL